MLKNKVAIVTGSSRGIGAAIAIKLAREGVKVVVNYNKSEEKAKEVVNKIKSIGSDAFAFQADVSNVDQIDQMVKQTIDTFKKIDVLVNNASIIRDRTLKNMSKSEWDEVISVNLTGVFNCTKAAVPYMIEQKSGNIVNISSMSALTGNFGQTNYCAAKAGVIGFTKALAKELASKGIRVNAIAPGFIETDMVTNIPKDIRDQILKQIPLNRVGTPEDVANAVLFLVSEDSSYITGQVINVNGGLYM